MLVPPGEPGTLSEAIVALLRDGPMRQLMGSEGREMVAREYDWNVILDNWVRTYEQVIDRHCSAV